MRLFCAIEAEPYPGNRLWQNNIVLALQDLGHEVVQFDYPIDDFYKHAEKIPAHRRWVCKHRPGLETALLAQVEYQHKQKPIDVFFSYFYSAHCTTPTILKIKEMGIKTVNWYCNASYQLDLVADLAPAYDLCLVPEKYRLDDYRQLGAHPIYCQEAANPLFYRNLDLPRDLGIVFFGHTYATRAAYVWALFEAGLPIDVWGNGWTWRGGAFSWNRFRRIARNSLRHLRGQPVHDLPRGHSHGFATDEEMVRIYNRAKIALGFGVIATTDFETKPKYQVRLRDFEAPISGTFYLTEYQEELQEFFEFGKEIETFKSDEELVDKARYYLSNDDARNQIRLAGRNRCLRDHTWQKRLTEAFQQLS